jgi:serine/threonine protein phosphatase PrpC
MTLIKIEQTGLTDIGNVRKANEDNFGFIEGKIGPIFTVCDGMGGHVGGATASQIAVKCILEYLSTSDLRVPSVEINNAIVLANQEILETAVANPELKGMGTTCTVMLVINDSIHIGHVGDSRIYLLSDNKLHRISKDHSFVQNLVDSGAISDSEAENHPRKNELTRALGVRSMVEPTTNSNPICPKQGDVFMLCSDGLSGLVNDSEMQNILNQNPQLDSAAQALIMAAKQAGGHDNITVQIARVIESPYKKSLFPDFSPKENLSKTFYQAPYEQEVPIKPKFPRNISKAHWLIYCLIVVSLTSGICLYQILNNKEVAGVAGGATNPNPTEEGKPKGRERGKGGPVVVVYGDEQLLSCDDTLKDGYLMHKVGEHQTYDGILNKHKEKYKEAYDFKEGFNENGSKVEGDKNIKAGQKIKWKKKKIVPQIVRKQPTEKKVTIAEPKKEELKKEELKKEELKKEEPKKEEPKKEELEKEEPKKEELEKKEPKNEVKAARAAQSTGKTKKNRK